MSFTCKDCETEFSTAKEFVHHVPSCRPENIKSLIIEVLQKEISARPLTSELSDLATAILKQFKVTKR
jgi:hypothetical protein